MADSSRSHFHVSIGGYLIHFSGAETALWSHMCSFNSSPRWIVWRVLWRSHYNRSFLPTSRSPSSWTSPVAPEVGVLYFLSHWSEEPPSTRPAQGCLLVPVTVPSIADGCMQPRLKQSGQDRVFPSLRLLRVCFCPASFGLALF